MYSGSMYSARALSPTLPCCAAELCIETCGNKCCVDQTYVCNNVLHLFEVVSTTVDILLPTASVGGEALYQALAQPRDLKNLSLDLPLALRSPDLIGGP